MNRYISSVDNIRELHVEVSTLCNAACPMCARNDHGYGSKVDLVHWGVEDHLLVFTPELVNLSSVYFCGSHGDPLTHPNLLSVIEHCKRNNIQVNIYTNGSLRSLSWWKDFLKLLTENDKIIFGIDGLKTNHLYRQNTDIDKILERLSMSCKSLAKTQWDFIPFEHNEHELEECKKLSNIMGVDFFRLRKTARFKRNEYQVKNPQTGSNSHVLRPPVKLELRHPNFNRLQEISTTQITEYNINCVYKNNNRMYVNSRLTVLPCSYIGSDLESKKQIANDQLQIPIEELCLKNNSWQNIMDNKFYSNDLVNSFNNKNTISRCVHTCGVVSRILNQNEVIKR